MRNRTILIADDDTDLAKILQKAFCEKDFKVFTADNGRDALNQYYICNPKIILMDIDMPEKNGWEVLRQIRQENRHIPVIIMTGKHIEEIDAIKSFSDGATFFIRKTISYKEIIALAESLFQLKYPHEDVLRFGNFTLNMSSLSLHSDIGKHALSDREAQLLSLLVRNINQIVLTENIIDAVWGNDVPSNRQMMRNAICKINRLINENGNMHIESIYGKGYRLL